MPIRVELNLDTGTKCKTLLQVLDGFSSDDFSLTNEKGNHVVDARSMLGVLYASGEFQKVYLINNTNDGEFPSGIYQLST